MMRHNFSKLTTFSAASNGVITASTVCGWVLRGCGLAPGPRRRCGRVLAAGIALLLLAGCHYVPPPAEIVGTGKVSVRFSGLRNDRGTIIVSLFTGPRGFPKDITAAQATLFVPITAGEAQAEFVNVPYGRYAVSALHDEDGDGQMATGWLGNPLEGFGFSGRPDYWFGRPSFAATSFPVLAPQLDIAIRMRYETARRQHQEEGWAGETNRPRE